MPDRSEGCNTKTTVGKGSANMILYEQDTNIVIASNHSK